MLEGDLPTQLVAAGARLAAAGLVRESEGNISARIDESNCLVTATGSANAHLRTAELIEVSLNFGDLLLELRVRHTGRSLDRGMTLGKVLALALAAGCSDAESERFARRYRLLLGYDIAENETHHQANYECDPWVAIHTSNPP